MKTEREIEEEGSERELGGVWEEGSEHARMTVY